MPDLWPLLPKRSLPLVVLRRLHATSGDSTARALAVGIESHLRADAAFHGHAEFQRRVELLAPRVASVWPGLRHAGIAAHVLVEMILDRWLMRVEPARLDSYYAAFTHEAVELACEKTTADSAASEALRELLRRFVDSAFLRDYCRSEGLAVRFLRTVGRTAFAATPPPVHEVALVVEEADEQLSEGSQSLLDAVRGGAGVARDVT